METTLKEIPILCINLPRATERRDYIEKEWIDKRGCSIHFIDACDRRDVDSGNLLFDYNKLNAFKYLKRFLSNGEIACNISHIQAIQYAKEMGMESVIIIEDDSQPLFDNYTELNKVISNLDYEFPDATVAMLHEAQGYAPYKTSTVKKYFSLISYPSYGNVSIFLKNTVFDRQLDYLKSFERPADLYWKEFVKTNSLVKATVPLSKHLGNSTYIGNENRGAVAHRTFIP